MNRLSTFLAVAGFLIAPVAIAQTMLNSRVLDVQSSEPLFGVAVVIKGSTNGAVTDLNGTFSLSFSGKFPVVLSASYIGYESKEIIVESNKKLEIYLAPLATSLREIAVTARRRSEEVQEIPISIAVLNLKALDNSTAFNVNTVKELVPSVQLYSSNPRNTTLNVRGVGSTFGLTNDGIDPGVGFYVDGVYFARPAAATLDFIDVQQIEVLKGPQGTLFGKNTTAGTFNITSRKPTFVPSGIFEQTFGNFGFI